MRTIPAVLTGSLAVAGSLFAHAGDVPVRASAPPAVDCRVEVVLRGLEHPWSMAWLPNGDMLITERAGRLRLVKNGALVPEPVRGVPEVFASGQGGLMDVSLHPDFATNGVLYLTHSEGTRDANRTVLVRGVYEGGALRDVETIFGVDQRKAGTQHFGSRIVWLPDGTMLLAVGDGGNPPVRYEGDFIRKQAQNLGADLGKIHRLNDDGSAPDDNPFRGREGVEPTIYTYGHRNIQGLARDPESGRVWATEHGPRGGDEVNLITPGGNYGWPLVTFGREYSGPKISERTSGEGFVDPTLAWVPSNAPSGLAFYTGDKFPRWKGDLFSGALMGQEVRRIHLDGARFVSEQSIAIGQRVRDVRQGPDGYLYVLTDERNGQLLRIVPASAGGR